MRDNEWPFGWTLLERAANKKSTSRVRFDPERVATFLLRPPKLPEEASFRR